MADLPAHVAQKARDEADQWESFKDGASFAGAGVIPVIIVAAGATIGVICGAAAAAMVMLGAKKARAAKRKADDPPDWDYTRPVIARRAHFNEDAFGNSPLERATVRAIYALLHSNAYDLAMVRAEERAAAAREAGDGDAARTRLEEARKFAYRSAESSNDVRRETAELANRFAALDAGREPFELRDMPRTLDQALPDQTLVILFRAGFRIEDLRLPIPRRSSAPDDPVGFVATELRKAGEASGEFGRELASVLGTVFRAES